MALLFFFKHCKNNKFNSALCTTGKCILGWNTKPHKINCFLSKCKMNDPGSEASSFQTKAVLEKGEREGEGGKYESARGDEW